MTSADYPSSGGTVPPNMYDDQRSAGERAQDAKDAAAQQGEQLRQTAAEETKNVASEAKEQARNVVDEARSQLQEQSRTQRDQLVQTLRGFAEDLDDMSSQAPGGLATDMTRQVAQKARDLSGHLSGREPGELLEDLRSYARRNPGKFLLGALAAGVVSGRLARGAKEGMSGSSQSSRQSPGRSSGLSPGLAPGSSPGLSSGSTSDPAAPEPAGAIGSTVPPATGAPPLGGEPL